MFYSHEVLTSRKHGVATVWLIATLGSKSTLKKVSRKAILDVNVPKACETILTPGAPMALRLQSNLLYGVSRVYSQQCTYVLSDAQTAQNNMRAMFNVVKTAELDAEAGRARPDQLLLEDDPSFLPDFALAPLKFDLSNLEVSSATQSSTLSPHSSRRSRLTPEDQHFGDFVGGLAIPTSDTSHKGRTGSFVVPGDEGPGTRISGSAFFQDEDGFLPEADFGFDADGNLVEFAGTEQSRRTMTSGVPFVEVTSDSAARERVRREHEGSQRVEAEPGGYRDVDMHFGEELELLPEGEAFPSVHDYPTSPSGRPLSQEEILERTSPVQATAQRKRKARVIAMDESMELHNTDLLNWMNQYPVNMAVANEHKQTLRINSQAKKNAEHWVVGAGLGNVGSVTSGTSFSGPLDMFRGDALLRSLGVEIATTVAGRKRAHEEITEEAAENERRIRRSSVEDQVGRGAITLREDSGFIPIEDVELEIPREAPEDTTEHISSAMPWNITASIRGSSVPRSVRTILGLGAGLATSTGAPSSIAGAAPSISRRTSRLVSASPLLGRGRGLEPLPSLELEEGGERFGADEAFELYGPAAAVDTQTANESQFLRAKLLHEEDNVRVWIYNAVREKLGVSADEEELPEPEAPIPEGLFETEVLFEDLMPPADMTNVAACHAFMHVLSLATKGLITAHQDEPFMGIHLGLVAVQP